MWSLMLSICLTAFSKHIEVFSMALLNLSRRHCRDGKYIWVNNMTVNIAYMLEAATPAVEYTQSTGIKWYRLYLLWKGIESSYQWFQCYLDNRYLSLNVGAEIVANNLLYRFEDRAFGLVGQDSLDGVLQLHSDKLQLLKFESRRRLGLPTLKNLLRYWV